MTIPRWLWAGALIGASLPLHSLHAQTSETSFVLQGARIHTAVGPPIEGGAILVEDGRIAAVGPEIRVPSGVRVIDVTGKTIIPGLIDEHSHLGTYEFGDVNESTEPIGPEHRALDALHMEVRDWYEAAKAGVTTIVTGPGSGERMGGQSITIKTFGENLDDRILKESRELKMAVNARSLSHIPTIRSTFLQAREYMEKWDAWEAGDKQGPPPRRDLRLEAIVPVLKGEEMVRCHIHYANDIISFLKLKDEFGFDLTFIHSSEAYKVADEIARRGVPVITLPLATRIGVSEDLLYGNTRLYEAGVRVSLHTDHPVVHEKLLRLNAAMVIKYGMPEDYALKAVTINPATSSRIQDRVGSIEIGKDADLVVLDGVWYEPSTRVDMVFVDGVKAYDRSTDDPAGEEN
jgi:imidazolonepropionase-like amidohydrolase